MWMPGAIEGNKLTKCLTMSTIYCQDAVGGAITAYNSEGGEKKIW